MQEPVCYIKGQVHSSRLQLCIGLNETYLCPAYNFVVVPASGMVRYKDLVFHPFVRAHQGAILLKALRGGISVLWTHFFSSLHVHHTKKYDFSAKLVFAYGHFSEQTTVRVCFIFMMTMRLVQTELVTG